MLRFVKLHLLPSKEKTKAFKLVMEGITGSLNHMVNTKLKAMGVLLQLDMFQRRIVILVILCRFLFKIHILSKMISSVTLAVFKLLFMASKCSIALFVSLIYARIAERKDLDE